MVLPFNHYRTEQQKFPLSLQMTVIGIPDIQSSTLLEESTIEIKEILIY